MRPPQYTLTPTPVHAPAAWLLDKRLRVPDHGPKCRAYVLWTVLRYAASRRLSLAAAGAALRDAPCDTAAHDALLATRPDFAQRQRRLNGARHGDRPQALRRRRQPLAVALVLVPYHGAPRHHVRAIYRSQARDGTSHFHADAAAYVLRTGQRFTVARTAVTADDPLPAVLRRRLRAAARAGVRPRYLLRDRGFCSAAVIRSRHAARYAWLMPLVRRGRKADHPPGAAGSRVFATGKRSGWGHYTMRNAAGRTARFRVCVTCRHRRGARGRRGRAALVYADGGPLRPSSYTWVQETYRRRLAIATSYRQMNQGRIRTCTPDPLLRLRSVGLALRRRNVWVWLHWQVLTERRRGPRRIDRRRRRFRQMLRWLQHFAEQWLGVQDETHAERSPWG